MAKLKTTSATTGMTNPCFFAIKLGVSDFERAAAFYGTLFGMRLGAELQVESERPLEWPAPGHGATIILFKHDSATRDAAAQDMSGIMGDIVNRKHPFKAGSSWTVFQVEDINKVAKELTTMGKEAEIFDAGTVGINFYVIMTTDLDDNVLEITQPY